MAKTNRLELVHSSRRQDAHPAKLDGILALLVTDLEGFTTLVEQLGDTAAQSVMRTHNELLRACIRRWEGQEVAHTGDGIIAAFRSVIAAISCAHDLQRRLAEQEDGLRHPLRARIGIHAGEPLPEEERLFGHCVNTAVRVCGMAEPGRVLVSEVIEQLARGRFMFGEGDLCSLKGLSRPMKLFCCEARA
ncbi:MAG TPA: adenylate/guanylate cyclase domain-containing protein [Polyangiales bacterium]|nr:adenylate/guanylate cyclase domain-containing protein [Polyangiales bacterium]